MVSANRGFRIPKSGLLVAIVLIAITSMLAFGSRDAAATDPAYCSDPYYSAYPECAVTGGGGQVKASVTIAMSKRCRSRNFVLRPSYSGAPVLSSKLYLNNRKYVFKSTGPFAFRVNVKRLRKGKTYKMRLATVFTSGEAVSQKFAIKRCGKPFKRQK